MTGKPVFAANKREKVLFRDPASRVTRARRPIFMAASLIDVTIPQVPHWGATSEVHRHSFVPTGLICTPVARSSRNTVTFEHGGHGLPRYAESISQAVYGLTCAIRVDQLQLF